MSERDWRRIRIDWEELEDAFADSCSDHRYYLDRETGAVHFFSSYLDNEDEEEDERALGAEGRYVLIPHELRLLPLAEVREFIATLDSPDERRSLEVLLQATDGYQRFEERVADVPAVSGEWQRFLKLRIGPRIKSWLAEVAVEPLE